MPGLDSTGKHCWCVDRHEGEEEKKGRKMGRTGGGNEAG